VNPRFLNLGLTPKPYEFNEMYVNAAIKIEKKKNTRCSFSKLNNELNVINNCT
jgi:hypothetical protein